MIPVEDLHVLAQSFVSSTQSGFCAARKKTQHDTIQVNDGCVAGT